jgi:hypothetical protein
MWDAETLPVVDVWKVDHTMIGGLCSLLAAAPGAGKPDGSGSSRGPLYGAWM